MWTIYHLSQIKSLFVTFCSLVLKYDSQTHRQRGRRRPDFPELEKGTSGFSLNWNTVKFIGGTERRVQKVFEGFPVCFHSKLLRNQTEAEDLTSVLYGFSVGF